MLQRSKSLNVNPTSLLHVEKDQILEFKALLRTCLCELEADLKRLVEAGTSDKGFLGLTLTGTKVTTVISGSPAAQPVTGSPLRPGDDLLRVNGVSFKAERSSAMISKAVRNSLDDNHGTLRIECRRKSSLTVDTVVCCLAASSSPLSSACHALTAAVLETMNPSNANRAPAPAVAEQIQQLAKHLLSLSTSHEEEIRRTIDKSTSCLAHLLELVEDFELKACKPALKCNGKDEDHDGPASEEENAGESAKAMRESQALVKELQERLKVSEMKLKEMKQSNESKLKKEQLRLEQLKMELQREFDEKLMNRLREDEEALERCKQEYMCKVRDDLSELSRRNKSGLQELNQKAQELEGCIRNFSIDVQSSVRSANQELDIVRCQVRESMKTKSWYLKQWTSSLKTSKHISSMLLRSRHKVCLASFLKWRGACTYIKTVLDMANFVGSNMIGLSRMQQDILVYLFCDLNRAQSLKRRTFSVEEILRRWKDLIRRTSYVDKLDVIFRRNISRRILDMWTRGRMLRSDHRLRVKISKKLCRTGHLRISNMLFAAWSRFVKMASFFFHKTSQRICQKFFKSWSSLTRMKVKLFSNTNVKMLKRCFMSSYSFFQRWKLIFSLKGKKSLSLKLKEKTSLKKLQSMMLQWAKRVCKKVIFAWKVDMFTMLVVETNSAQMGEILSRARTNDFLAFISSQSRQNFLHNVLICWRWFADHGNKGEDVCCAMMRRQSKLSIMQSFSRWKKAALVVSYHLSEMNINKTNHQTIKKCFSLWSEEIARKKHNLRIFQHQRQRQASSKSFWRWLSCYRDLSYRTERSELFSASLLNRRRLSSYLTWRERTRRKISLRRLMLVLQSRLSRRRKEEALEAFLESSRRLTNLLDNIQRLLEKALRHWRSKARFAFRLEFSSLHSNLQQEGFKLVRRSRRYVTLEDDSVAIVVPLSVRPKLLGGGDEETIFLFLCFHHWSTAISRDDLLPSTRALVTSRSRRCSRLSFLTWRYTVSRRRRQEGGTSIWRRRVLVAALVRWKTFARARHHDRRILRNLERRRELFLLSSFLDDWSTALALREKGDSARRRRQSLADRVLALYEQEDQVWMERLFERWRFQWLRAKTTSAPPPLPSPPPCIHPTSKDQQWQCLLELFVPFTHVRSYRKISFNLWRHARPMPAACVWTRLLLFLLYKHRDHRTSSVLAAWQEESEKKVRSSPLTLLSSEASNRFRVTMTAGVYPVGLRAPGQREAALRQCAGLAERLPKPSLGLSALGRNFRTSELQTFNFLKFKNTRIMNPGQFMAIGRLGRDSDGGGGRDKVEGARGAVTLHPPLLSRPTSLAMGPMDQDPMALVSNSERLRNQVLEMRSSEFDVGMLDKSFRRAYELAPTAIPVSRKKKKKGLLSIYNTEEEPDDMSSRLPFIEESQKKEMDARQQQKLEARQWGNEFVIWRDDFDPGSNETLRETFVSRAKNTYMDVKKRSNNFKDHIVDNGMLRPEYNEVRAKTFEKVMLARNLQYDDIKKKSERRVEKTMADAGHRTCTPSRRRTGRAEGSTLAPQTSKERGERGGMVSIRPKEVKKSQNWKATPNFKHSALLVKHERRRSLEGILKPSGSLTRMGTKPVSPVSRIPSELSTSPQSYEAMYEEEDFVLHAPTPEVVVDVLESFKGKRKEIVEKGMKAQQDLSSSRAEVDAEIQRLKSIESVKKVSKREKVKQLTQSMRQPSPTPKESAESSDELRTPRGPPLLREPVYAEMTEENDGSLLTKGKTLRRPEREISIYVGEEEDQPEQGSEGSEEGSRVRTEEEERSLAVLRKFYPNNHIPAAKSSKPLFPFSADGEGGGGGKLEPALSPRMLTKSTLDSLPLRVPDGYMTTMMAEQEVEDEIEQMQETFYEKDAR
ncbi:hypothetical protein GUITHDRAFT_142914 [Guillardia theta CCMP2712]|uniref:PDZ domain-containing protein n=1 Tax=Guillardia theta (strain CCMP2712) TaxID=905079 RepID=L1IVQ5_GUITC|nr:hypothetical protein GUITHDRAFT_142914 [Guillardia theta CCMP2712]EKX40192.1 hypothetical protein GUITHDRAFT_142914 [Guillardia theta CCMP2712]|eukprot:XP_005827172.1 hypothetical protein GUITHDRAFT_142914 [Guillardia theta CCMP2712]